MTKIKKCLGREWNPNPKFQLKKRVVNLRTIFPEHSEFSGADYKMHFSLYMFKILDFYKYLSPKYWTSTKILS